MNVLPVIWRVKFSFELFLVRLDWLKCPLNGLWALSSVSPVVGLLPLASGQACFGIAFPPFLMKQLYRCDSVIIASFVVTGYTTRRWGWLLARRGYGIGCHYPLYWETSGCVRLECVNKWPNSLIATWWWWWWNFPFHRSGNAASAESRLEVSQSGMPWWRRHAEHGPGVAESRH
jgi:hypothetical protein